MILFFRCKYFVLLLPGLLWGAVAAAQNPGAQSAPWMQLSNQISVSAEHYIARGIDGRQMPLTWVVQGAPTLQIGDTPVPFQFTFSSFENSYQTPFNQMGTSPKYKWIQVHLGYRNLQFSNYTMGGQRMLGAGVELTPGRWHMGFFWGLLRKAIAPDSTQNNIAPPGSLSFGPGYRRTGWGAKVGYGKKEGSNIALSAFRGKDHENSLDEQFHTLVRKPEANMALGINWRVKLSERWAWLADAAVSAYTRNGFSDSLSLEGIPAADFIASVFLPRNSSQYLGAMETSIQYADKKFKASAKYRRVAPDFKSMGIYFINSDLEEITFNPGWRVNKKVNLTGSIGVQRDNLKDLKQRTTERLIYRAGVDWTPKTWFGLGLQHTNFGITQNALAPNIADTTLVRQVNSMWAAQPRFTIMKPEAVQVIVLNMSRQALSNAFSGAFAPPDVRTDQLTAVYSYTFVKKAISLSPSFTWVDVRSELFETQSIGGSLGVGLPLKIVPVQAQLQSAWFSNRVDGVGGGSTATLSAQLNYKLKNGMAFQAGTQYLKNMGSVSQALPEFSELRLRAGFTWSIAKQLTKKKKKS